MAGEAGVWEGCKMLGYGVGWAAKAGLMYDGSSICSNSKMHFFRNASSNLEGKQAAIVEKASVAEARGTLFGEQAAVCLGSKQQAVGIASINL